MLKQIARSLLRSGLPVPRIIRPFIRMLYRLGVVVTEGLILLRKILWVEPVLRSVAERVGGSMRADNLPYIRGTGRLIVGDNVNLSGRSCFYFMNNMPEKPVIEVGNNVFVGNGCTFSAAKEIVIGNHVLISAGVRIHDNDGHPLDAAKRMAGDGIEADDVKPVRINDGVWIGAQAIILKGVTIGQNAVVGAGSVVLSDVPASSVVAGNPAMVVKTLVK